MRIEKNIPIPKKRYLQKTRKCKYPLSEMEVGDSFFVPTKPDEYKIARGRMHNVVCKHNKRNNVNSKFSIRQVEGGLRVWRIK